MTEAVTTPPKGSVQMTLKKPCDHNGELKKTGDKIHVMPNQKKFLEDQKVI